MIGKICSKLHPDTEVWKEFPADSMTLALFTKSMGLKKSFIKFCYATLWKKYQLYWPQVLRLSLFTLLSIASDQKGTS